MIDDVRAACSAFVKESSTKSMEVELIGTGKFLDEIDLKLKYADRPAGTVDKLMKRTKSFTDPDTDLVMYEVMEYMRKTTKVEKRSREEHKCMESEVTDKPTKRAKQQKQVQDKENMGPAGGENAGKPEKKQKEQKPFTEKQVAALDKTSKAYSKMIEEMTDTAKTIDDDGLQPFMPAHLGTKLASHQKAVEVEIAELDLVRHVGKGSLSQVNTACTELKAATKVLLHRMGAAMEEANIEKQEHETGVQSSMAELSVNAHMHKCMYVFTYIEVCIVFWGGLSYSACLIVSDNM